jgi:YD repeat-containing protein
LPVFYTWDLEGNRTSISIEQTGYWVTTEYDANHRPVRMVDQQNGDVWYFNYDAANRRTSVVYPDGSAIFTVYDAAGQVVEQPAVAPTGEILFLEQNAYDPRGNIVETVTETERRTYEYNARDWLTRTSVEN